MSAGAPRIPVYLDCDTGIDDALAIAYLLASPEVELVGIGTVSGNVDAQTAARNSLDLVALAGFDVPVAVGAMHHLVREYGGHVAHIHGANGTGDVDLPHSGTEPIGGDAVDLLLRLSHEHAGELVVLAVGPYTNLALALERDPSLVERVARVVVMGGAAMVPGNMTQAAEANVANDAEAADVVVRAGWDLTLVPLDVTLEERLTDADRDALLASDRPLARALGAVLDVYFTFYLAHYGERLCALHDPLAAAIVTGGATASLAPLVRVTVDTTDGPGRGQTICDLRGRHRGYPVFDGANARVVLALEEPFAPHLMARLLEPAL